MNEIPTPETPKAKGPIILEEHFKPALIGHTVSATEQPRFAYSINRMTKIVMKATRRSRTAVMPEIFEFCTNVTAEHGDRAPIFIDASASATISPIKRIFIPN